MQLTRWFGSHKYFTSHRKMVKTNELIDLWFSKTQVSFLLKEKMGRFLPKHHIQKHKLTITGSLSNKFSSNVLGWQRLSYSTHMQNILTSSLTLINNLNNKTINQVSIILCECLLNKNIRKLKFLNILSSSTFHSDDLLSFLWLTWLSF